MTLTSTSTANTVNRKVLVVDDSPEVLDVITSALSGSYQIYATTKGRNALDIARKHHPALILLDVIMPEMDGYAVCEQLRSDPETSAIPVIFVSGLDSEGDELKGFALGAVDYVTKPVQPVILQARVKTQIELSEARKGLHEANEQLLRERELFADIIMGMRHNSAFCDDQLTVAEFSFDLASGDLMLSARRPNGDQHILVGDFTGHGLPAAIGSPLVAQAFYSMTSQDYPLSTVLRTINNVLVEQLPVHIFMVAVGLTIPADKQPIRTWSFGAPDVLLMTQDGDWQHYQSQETPMGIVELSEDPAGERLSDMPGQVYVFTDGPIEVSSDTGDMLGVEGLKILLEASKGDVYQVVEQIVGMADDPALLDDMTLLRIDVEQGSRTDD